MSEKIMPANTFEVAERRLDELIQRYQQLKTEYKQLADQHQQLCQQQQLWTKERERLLEKQEIAKARIESMINKLGKLEVYTQ